MVLIDTTLWDLCLILKEKSSVNWLAFEIRFEISASIQCTSFIALLSSIYEKIWYSKQIILEKICRPILPIKTMKLYSFSTAHQKNI